MKAQNQQQLETSIISDLLGAPKMIAGIELKPVTLASIAILKQVDSPLIEGRAYDEIENIILDCCIFLKIQSSDIKTAQKLAFGDRNILISEALELAANIEPSSIKDVVQSIVELLQDSTSTKVNVVPDEDSSAEDPAKLLGEINGDSKEVTPEGNL